MPDHARRLTDRGLADAAVLAEALARTGIEVDVAYVSDAPRARQTWDAIARGADVPDVRVLPELYRAGIGEDMALLRGTPPGATTVAVVGHNPTVSGLAAHLAGAGSRREAVDDLSFGLSTGTAAVLEYDGEWADLGEGTARLRAVVGRDG